MVCVSLLGECVQVLASEKCPVHGMKMKFSSITIVKFLEIFFVCVILRELVVIVYIVLNYTVIHEDMSMQYCSVSVWFFCLRINTRIVRTCGVSRR